MEQLPGLNNWVKKHRAWNHSTHLTWPLCWNATILPCQYKDQLHVALDILTYSEHLQPLLPELLTHLDMRRYRQSNNRSCMSRMSCQKNKLHSSMDSLHYKTIFTWRHCKFFTLQTSNNPAGHFKQDKPQLKLFDSLVLITLQFPTCQPRATSHEICRPNQSQSIQWLELVS